MAMDAKEASFLLFMRRKERKWVFDDIPYSEQGEEMTTDPIPINNRARKLHKTRAEEVYSFAGHTHPQPAGELILPYNCGWTFPRRKEDTLYRNRELAKTREGRRVLCERRRLITQATPLVHERYAVEKAFQQASQEGNEKARQELGNEKRRLTGLLRNIQDQNRLLAPHLHTTNLRTERGIHGFVTNQFYFKDPAHLEQDTNPYSGDFAQGRIFPRHSFTGQALIHADPRHVGTPASADKFYLSVLRTQEEGLEHARLISYQRISGE